METLQKIQERYYWPGYESDTTVWVRECRECQRRNLPQVTQQVPLESIVNRYPFEKLSWDIMGPLPQTSSGNKYIVVVTDQRLHFPLTSRQLAVIHHRLISLAMDLAPLCDM